MRWTFLVLLSASGSSCGEEPEGDGDADTDTDTDTGTDTGTESETDTGPPPPPCGSGNRPLPEGLVELSSDDGEPAQDLHDQTWQYPKGAPISTQRAWEAKRFELPHPARIHGFSVAWTNLPDAEATFELPAGLYGDFGHNGFDFWAPEPLWSGTRCLEDAQGGEWVDYVFDEPVEVGHPGLVYVAHEKDAGAQDALFAMDATYRDDGNCATSWSTCTSALNLPEADPGLTYNGVSFPIPYDYLVRLHVEWTDSVAPEELVFRPVADVPVQSRAAWGDYDRDGWDDLYTQSRLLRNQGDGTFADVTEAAGLGGGGSGGVWGDFDNDDCLDLFVFDESPWATDRLWRGRCDGTFEDATAASTITDVQDDIDCNDAPDPEHSATHAAAWFDVDGDGLLDLYLANYECNSEYYRDHVFHNEGGGVFSNWSGTNGFLNVRFAGRGASPIDADQDGDVDILVNDYRLHRNLYYVNGGAGRVVEDGFAMGLAGVNEGAGAFGHTIATAWGDLDGDGDFDSVQANLAHPRFFHFSDKTQVLLQQPDGTFDDTTALWEDPWSSGSGLRYQETHSAPELADFDQDGALDLVVSCVYPGRPTDFYWGNGDGTFTLDSYRSGLTVTNGWGMAASDFDHDGDVDLAYSGLWENTLGGTYGHFLQVRAVGDVSSNRAAVGATVRVTAGGRTFVRHVPGGSGQGCQASQYLHFGLGDAEEVDRVEIDFPGGGTVVFEGPWGVDRRLWLHESGAVEEGWAPPAG